jgi:hypothetical protein
MELRDVCANVRGGGCMGMVVTPPWVLFHSKGFIQIFHVESDFLQFFWDKKGDFMRRYQPNL